MENNKLKEIIESNLSADTKVELIKLLLRDRDKEETVQPYIIEKRTLPQDWDDWDDWDEEDVRDKVTASDWWKQQMKNRKADCVTNNPVHYQSSHNKLG